MDQKYQIGNEYGSIMWDINKIINDKDQFNIKEYDVEELIHNNPFNGNHDHVMNTDISEPLIVVNLIENIDKLIDGNHRLQKAFKLGYKKIKAYYLTIEEHNKYIVDYDEKVYQKVVQNWN